MREGMSRGNQARIPSAHATAVSTGIDGQEEEQTAGFHDAQRRDTIVSMPCGSSTIQTRSKQPLSAHVHAETRPDVQHALFLVWHAANRICAKRLIPFLPTLVEAAYAA